MMERIKQAAAWAIIVCFIGLIFSLLYGEFQLFIKHDYTIATVNDIYRGGKLEMKIMFTYIVGGVTYEQSATWNRKVRVGERYLVRYAVYAPYGNKFLFEEPVPDSIRITHGPQWEGFLKKRELY
jgi:hypothetical protein